MEFLNYPPMQLTAIGIMAATLLGAAIRLCVITGSRGVFRDLLLAPVIIIGTSTMGFGIGAHLWLLIVGGWSIVVLAWVINENLR